MTYNVFGRTLNLAQLQLTKKPHNASHYSKFFYTSNCEMCQCHLKSMTLTATVK